MLPLASEEGTGRLMSFTQQGQYAQTRTHLNEHRSMENILRLPRTCVHFALKMPVSRPRRRGVAKNKRWRLQGAMQPCDYCCVHSPCVRRECWRLQVSSYDVRLMCRLPALRSAFRPLIEYYLALTGLVKAHVRRRARAASRYQHEDRAFTPPAFPVRL